MCSDYRDFILQDWAIAFTVLYLTTSTETSFNGAAGQESLLGCCSPAVKCELRVSGIPAPSNPAGVLT